MRGYSRWRVCTSLMFLCIGAAVFAQQASVSPAFEVASVKQNKSGDQRVQIGFPPGGRFTATNATLRSLIAAAYGAPQPLPGFRVLGGPSWMDSDRFDIAAKAATDIPQTGPAPPDELFQMLRTLLNDRFHLLVHAETRDLPVFELVLAKTDGQLGPQMQKTDVDCAQLAAARRGGPPPAPPRPGERPLCGMSGGLGRLMGGGITMPQLVNLLSARVNRPVVDKTGLTGSFDIELAWTPDQLLMGPQPPGAPPPLIDPNAPSIFTAVEENLGLKLNAATGPVDVVIIDRVEHPTED